MLGHDQDDDIPRLKSFSGSSTESELTSKAAKQKKKRDPSPLSRMGSSLLRPFTKGLSKLRTSRSSDKDEKLQAQSQTASQSDSLASRVTSVSTLDSGVPSRFNSISLQPQIQTAQGAKVAAGRSESFRFNSPATQAPPDLAAEPSFAQDLPHNSRTSHQSSVLPTKPAAAAASVAADTAPSQARSQAADRRGAVPGLSNLSSVQAGHSSDDDEFSYDFSQTESWPAAGRRKTASASAAAVPQPRSATTSSAQPEAAVSRDSKAGSGTKLLLEADAGGLSGHQVADSGPERSRGSFVEAGKFRPQLSRAERPQLAIATASVYSPLEVGAATSPTMRANANGEGIQGKANRLREAHVESSSEAESTSPASTSAAAAAAEEIDKQRFSVVLQNSIGDAQGETHSQPPKDSSAQGSLPATTLEAASAGGKGGQLVASSSGDNTAGQKTPGQMASSSASEAAAQGLDSLSAESLSSASSAGSSEFDILEAAPYQSPHNRSTVAHAVQKEAASPGRTDTAQSRAEQYNVQGSGYSTSPILGPASSQVQPSGDGDCSIKAVLGSAAVISQGSASAASQQPHETLAGIGQVSAQARQTSPRKGFSDKPILAVYSRRPSADEEATQEVTGSSRRQQQSSDDAMQAKVPIP